MTITDRDMRRQVKDVTDAAHGEFDVDAIVTDIRDRFGTVSVDSLAPEDFWLIISEHEI